MEEEFNLKDEIKKLKDKINEEEPEKKKKKSFRIPYKAKLSKKNLKDNYATIMLINENKQIEWLKAPIDESTMKIKGIPRLGTTDDILYDRKKPLIILPNWSVKPFSTKENYEETVKDKMTSQGYALLMNRMQKEAIALKKKISGFLILIIIAIIGVAAFILLGGGKYIGLQ